MVTGNSLITKNSNKYVIFKLDDEFYGIPIDKVKTIERILAFTRVPNSPEYIKGVINLRGEVVPVVDLRKRFKNTDKDIDKDCRIIIITYSEILIGLLVDTSSEVLEIGEDEIDNISDVSSSVSESFIKGIGKKDGRLILILDIKEILSIKDNS